MKSTTIRRWSQVHTWTSLICTLFLLLLALTGLPLIFHHELEHLLGEAPELRELPGKLLLAFMGVLFVVAIISGVVLYAPFMRRLKFAEVRHEKSTRTRWLDLHNLIDIVTLTWALVVGVTGVISACADLLISAWRTEALAAMVAPYRDAPPLTERAPVNQVLTIAAQATPGMQPDFIAFPGTRFSSEHHYSVFMKGNTHLTAHLWTPVLIDARSLEVTAIGQRPWYMDALSMSQPLHFGDYGGMPMKVLWAVLDVLTIIVLGSGLYAGEPRRRNVSARRPQHELAPIDLHPAAADRPAQRYRPDQCATG